MKIWENDWAVFVFAVFVASTVLLISYRLIFARQLELTAEQRLPRQIAFIVLMLIAVIGVTLSLPVSESSRNQVLALVGVLTSGVIAFSSTTLVTNLIAGLVLRFNRPFRTGDFIRCNEFFGRVSEKGLLDTEIQTEQRDLIAIANSYLVNNPVTVIRASGTLVSASVSIGYDVHHSSVSQLLEQAVQDAELSDGFVQITELGDFSVSYRVSGLLTDVKRLLTAKSILHCAILDALHDNGIEIMSPNVVMQRPSNPDRKVLAQRPNRQPTQGNKNDTQEDIAFDKAEKAEQHEFSMAALQEDIARLNERIKNSENEQEAQQLRQQLQEMQTSLQQKVTEKTSSEE